MRKLIDVEAELATAKEELDNAGNPKSQLLCGDDDDSYQENLELGWWREEQQALIKSLEEELLEIEVTYAMNLDLGQRMLDNPEDFGLV